MGEELTQVIEKSGMMTNANRQNAGRQDTDRFQSLNGITEGKTDSDICDARSLSFIIIRRGTYHTQG